MTAHIIDEMLEHAIRDALQTADPHLCAEARAWLWVCCPDVADDLGLAYPADAQVQQQATHYSYRFAVA
ncbi:MAG: hypothetical protein R3C14_07455 [Caldilineaceae bacterium]